MVIDSGISNEALSEATASTLSGDEVDMVADCASDSLADSLIDSVADVAFPFSGIGLLFGLLF